MKKLLFIFIGAIISSMLGMTVSLAASGTIGSLVDNIFDEAGVQDTWGDDAKDLEKLADDDEPFANLYLYVYKNVVDGPKNAALKEVASRTKYDKSDLEKIVFEGDTSPITAKFNEKTVDAAAADIISQQEAEQAETDQEFESMIASSGLSGEDEALAQYIYDTYYRPEVTNAEDLSAVLSQEYVLEEYSYLSGLFESEYEFQMNNKHLAYEALASEMFMDGDKSNSAGIDLIADLDLINQALFGYELEIESRDSVVLSSEEENEYYEEDVLLAAEDEDLSTSSSETADSTELENPYTCFEDEALREALDTYVSTGGPTSSETNTGDDAGVVASDTTSTTTYSSSSEEPDDELDVKEEFQDLLDSLTSVPGDWTRSLPCNDIFCITVNLVTETNDPSSDSDYEDTENCIACHTTYINSFMKQTLSKSLVPSKVSMNWFEDATCKEAGILAQLDMHVYAVPQPITLDSEDDTDDLAQERVENLQEAIESAESRYGDKTRADVECESIINMSQYSSQTDFEEAMSACENASNSIQSDIDSLFEDFVFESETQMTDNFYDQFSAELNTLFTYFKSFDDALSQTYESDNAPLSSIVDKPFCQ